MKPVETVRYRQIASLISSRLQAGEWTLGAQLPSLRQFAAEYGVSLKTMQRVFKLLRAEGRIRARPRRRSQAGVGAPVLSIINNSIALVLSQEFHNILLSETGANVVLRGLMRGIRSRSSVIVLHGTRWRQEFPAGLRDLPLLGIMLFGPFKYEILRLYEDIGVPAILVDQPPQSLKIHSVSLDNYNLARDATLRLVDAGHRRIAFLRAVISSMRDIDPDVRERERGFMDACKSAGLAHPQVRVYTTSALPSQHTVRQMLLAEPRHTAVFAADAGLAQTTLRVAKTCKLQVPRDLSVVTLRVHGAMKVNFSGPEVDFIRLGVMAYEILRRNPPSPAQIRIKAPWKNGDTLGNQLRIKK